VTDQPSSFPSDGAERRPDEPVSADAAQQQSFEQKSFAQQPAGQPGAERPAPAEQPYFVPTEHQQAWSAAQHYYGSPQSHGGPNYGGPNYGAPNYGAPNYYGGQPAGSEQDAGAHWQPPPTGYQPYGYQAAGQSQPGYPYFGHPAGYWAPPPAQHKKHPHRLLYGSVAAAVAAALTVGGVALAVDHANSSSNQTSLATPSQNNPFSPNGSGSSGNGSGSTGGNGFGFGGQGGQGGQSGSGQGTGQATSAQSVGVVDIDTTLDYGQGKAAGTGIVLSSNGEILTNNHVVQDSTAISVTVVSTGKTYTAKVVGTDPSDDVAVIQLQNASGLATAKLGDSGATKVGDAVTAVGNAGGTGGTPSSASGSVSALDQSITASDQDGSNSERLTGLIQVDADIQAGDSGGPLYDNASGTVIGMDTAASSSGSRFSSGSTTGFAIPIAKATSIAKQIENGTDNATIHQGYPAFLGVQLSSDSQAQGATVAGVVPGSGAAKAGLAAGDVITSVDGSSVADATGLSSLLTKHHPGDQVRIGYTDGSGQTHSTTVTLGEGPAD